eukprot:TRINITY_DN6567_c0_g1_i1.p1 TRINITY_DN6567_c0_g1~~TRINITY_DN6567_c0_g1_i1.p1  ORF type:complete len:265 (-),score=69.19 TRINITY_DN6567_c0_g1_i1:788-1582(-)
MNPYAVALAAALGTSTAQILEVKASPGFLLKSERKDIVVVGDADEAPVFPKKFHINFDEVSSMRRTSFPFTVDTRTNKGSFHYDVANGREVWIHGKGQGDNWCQCAGSDTDAECRLMSVPADKEDGGGAMWVVFPTLKKCCKVGPYASGFGPLRPDWLRVTKAKKSQPATKHVGGRKCTTWEGGPPGDTFMMLSDDWSFDEQGLPCTYTDHFKPWAARVFGASHVLTFDAASYSEEGEAEDVFALPAGMSCEETCPNKEGWCKA